MATKQYYATGSFKYQTRMLRAGDPIELDGPNARLFMALNKISERAPSKPRPAEPVAEVTEAPVVKPRAPRKRSAKKSK